MGKAVPGTNETPPATWTGCLAPKSETSQFAQVKCLAKIVQRSETPRLAQFKCLAQNETLGTKRNPAVRLD
jgi:hypothetical protein